MYKNIYRLNKILDCMDEIDFVMDNNKLKVTQAIENKVFKAAIRMNIVRIAEQFNKLKDNSEFKLLDKFDGEDVKGINAVRNYIAHDYDSVNDEIIENAVRYRLPKIRETIENIKSSLAMEDIKNEINSSQNKDEKVQETNTQVNIRKNK